MVKFGGSGRAKQACVNRRCPNMVVKEAEDDDLGDEDDNDTKINNENKCTTPTKIHKTASNAKAKLKWEGEPIKVDGKHTYYEAIKLDDEMVSCTI